MNNTILLINNYNILQTIPLLLQSAGYAVETVYDTEAGLRKLENSSYAVVIALENPGYESSDICKKIRDLTNTALIIISPNAGTSNCVKAIDAGVDYFMRKTFGPLELLARVNSLSQRVITRQPVTITN